MGRGRNKKEGLMSERRSPWNREFRREEEKVRRRNQKAFLCLCSTVSLREQSHQWKWKWARRRTEEGIRQVLCIQDRIWWDAFGCEWKSHWVETIVYFCSSSPNSNSAFLPAASASALQQLLVFTPLYWQRPQGSSSNLSASLHVLYSHWSSSLYLMPVCGCRTYQIN